MNEIILLGAGGHANSCIDVIEQSKQFRIAGLVADFDSQKRNLPYPLLGNDDDLEKFREKYDYAFIAIGQIKTPSIRINLFERLKKITTSAEWVMNFILG